MARDFSAQFYHSKEWKTVREYVLMRDSYICRHCGKPAQEVHHIIHLTEDNIHDVSIALNPDNLISLCKDCHFEEHYQDKGNGHRKKHIFHEDEQYYFDENGYLQKRV